MPNPYKQRLQRLKLLADAHEKSATTEDDFAVSAWHTSSAKLIRETIDWIVRRDERYIVFAVDQDYIGGYQVCLDDWDLDVTAGYGDTPMAAIQDLLDNSIDDLDIQVMGMTEYRKAMKLEVGNAG